MSFFNDEQILIAKPHNKRLSASASSPNVLSRGSADDVLLYESERMEKYIPIHYLHRINTLKDALKAVSKIGELGDVHGILKNNLIPETSPKAKKFAALEYLKKYGSKNFYSKYRWSKEISYTTKKGIKVSYIACGDIRTGKRVKTPKRFKC